jgi:hypothetical protein
MEVSAMVSIRCESATCSCQSEVLFHAGTSSYCSEYCASAEPDAAAPCECTHAGCEAADDEREGPITAIPLEDAGPR